MGYCRHKKDGGFHICASHQFNLWQQGIHQGDMCDVHYWEVEAARVAAIAKDHQVTINLLKNQVEAFRKGLAHAKGMEHTEWHKGHPPHIGWWRTFMGDWRWWNGKVWSASVSSYMNPPYVMKRSQVPYNGDSSTVLWSDYYPAYARVPRVNPNESKI